jgi:uncharacterized membrane protein
MIERVHEHMIKELDQNTRTDTIFVTVAIILNLLILGVNAALASDSRKNKSLLFVMFIFVAFAVVVNLVVISGMLRGKQTRVKLLNGLIKMYKDQGVEGYYDPSLLGNYSTRYNLFIFTVVFLGIISIVIPFVVR